MEKPTQTLSSEQNTIHPALIRLLLKRGLTENDIHEFLSWDLKKLPLINHFLDLDKSAIRIIEAIEQKQNIGIYGDYDVDGTTSCALLYHFFQMLGVEVNLVQPSRFIEGYGIHPSGIDQAIEKDIRVLITVDCGISNNEAAEYALNRNIDLIITDHHTDARDEMPKAFAIVNPNRRDENQDQQKKLAGVGVAFSLCLKIKEHLEKKGQVVPTLYPLLQFVAIGTICDLAELNFMNLKLVRHGIKQFKNTQFAGIRIFFTQEELNQRVISSEKLSFNIGPMINSKGRLDHPEMALKLLISKSEEEARELYHHLDVCNKERRFIQNEVYDEAKKQVLKELKDNDHLISICYGPTWHEGVIGIVASKLVENFKVPAIVFADAHSGDGEELIKASIRSAGALNIFDILKKHEHLFLKFGGHAKAAGLTMPKKNLGEFSRSMHKELKSIPEVLRTKLDQYDLELDFDEITPKLVRDLEFLEPFGLGNEKPIFKIQNIRLESFDILKEAHVRWNLTSTKDHKKRLKGISFNYIGKWNQPTPEDVFKATLNENQNVTIFFTLGINKFNGNEFIQLMIERVEI